ncbi:hypothetical protein JJC00_33525 [Bradyrhizobium diazoefficiens]|uniref:hypothetical protein n=1 Tax=Bradyrhizobium diazoefficiens TaxID=1355477 RepID=UPI00190C3D82|nr:hypothetical protein [Bradyrhizobium diazoefficiens]QQO37931.1 hypothetical protein JJC00_33525 [Bradyrhizobium diazoefficiens]
MGQRVRPTAAESFAPADLLQGILVVSSFGFWAVMLGLMPVLLFGSGSPDDARPLAWLSRGHKCAQNASAAAARNLKTFRVSFSPLAKKSRGRS